MTQHILLYDTDLRRPACVLLQAAYGCGSHPHALRHFDARTWLVSPTPGMRKVAATDEQWAQIAESMMNKSNVSILKPGIRVVVRGKRGTVRRVHEPRWVDHKTRQAMVELQAADIVFDDTPAYHSGIVPSAAIPCEWIELEVDDDD